MTENACGFPAVFGISMEPFEMSIPLPEWLEADPKKAYPWANALWLAMTPYAPFDVPPGCLAVPAYYFASHTAHTVALDLVRQLTANGCRATIAKDIPLAAAARRAGHGERGDNGLYFWPPHGCAVVLTALATESLSPWEALGQPPWAPLTISHGAQSETSFGLCHHCGLCTAACPSGALTGDGWVGEKCLRRHLMHPPHEIWPLYGRLAFGCDICTNVCPHTAPANAELPQGYAALFNIASILAEKDLTLRSQAIAALIGKNMAKPSALRKAAEIAAENGHTVI